MKLKDRMLRSIKQRPGNVILRAEFGGMGSVSQVTKVLKVLQVDGVLVRIGVGVYAKTRRSTVTGAIIPAGTLETLAVEALDKLGVEMSPGSASAAYNAGKTTQLPGAFVLNTGLRRISRRIVVGGRQLVYERGNRG